MKAHCMDKRGLALVHSEAEFYLALTHYWLLTLRNIPLEKNCQNILCVPIREKTFWILFLFWGLYWGHWSYNSMWTPEHI